MKVKSFDAISFDAFGTLVEIGDHRHAYAKLLKNLGLQKTGLGRRVMTTNADIQAVLTELNISHIPAEVLSEFQEDLQAEVASIQLFPGVADILTHLRTSAYKLWVVSNLAPPYGPPLIVALTDYVDGFSLSYLCGSVKPESTIFMQVCKGLKIPVNRILMVGNNPIDDIEGAQRFGIQAVLVPAEGINMSWMQRVLEAEEVEDMTGCLARYAKDKPEKPFSEVREEVWKKVIKDRESKDGRREKDLCEPENEAEK
jgi:HAD superfamily hydrolase (TIGR01549 family)